MKIIVTFALLSSLSCLSLHSYAGTKRFVDTATNAPKVIKPVPPAPKPPAIVKIKPQTPRHLCSVSCVTKPKNTFNQAATADVKASGASIKSAADALGAGNRLARMQRVNTSKLSPQDAKAFFSSKYFLEKKLETARTAAKKQEAKRFEKDKAALVDMAKFDKKRGITDADMRAYKDLNKELKTPFPKNQVRGPEAHPGRGYGSKPHGHVGPVNHIPITDS